ncbi:hypothetical protein EUTSA_v10016294mg [Eutrema salsugineum]|uniref:SWIM-type domain-containing protein n=1 Tax=Eutrema salsugineum TaxID=72664 RepID=V4M979_EUTSA|nr:uncharacterized protein LOC18026885 [Eutrema salsugineum]XP_024003788.1 uncharacterized protein LOC18026885 [Eutrema salsugineum]ESQ51622.1 hypothetical protein EUTSA_v10016294mg [Eutrema salsugineum]
MADHELMMAGNHNNSFRQEHFVEARQNSELFPTHDYSFALEPLHETNLQIGVSREQNEVWNHNQERALSHVNSKTHSEEIHEEEQCLEGKDEVDSQDNNQNESYDHAFDLSFPDNDDSETSENDKLALVVSHDLNDNLQLAVGHCMNRDPIPGLDISPSQQLELAPPVVQSRSLVTDPDHNLVVGMEFSDVYACRRALRDAAIALRFEMQTVKSDKTRFTAKCASEGCPWRIHCAKLPGLPTFTIRTIHGSHTCSGILHLGHHQASVQWVAEAVKERLRVNPQCKPKEILEEIHQVHGITLSYKQAWRGKERIMAAVRGSFEEDYRLLPRYCDEIKRTNPGSIAVVHGSPVDGSFQQLFISFQASIVGFLNACRPLVALDKVVLKSKYLGTLLLATGFDGDGAIFPLAFAIITEENDSNWEWFLSELRQLLEVNSENMPKLTILSNMEKPIVDGVEANFPTSFHGFSIHHLTECLRSKCNNSDLVNLFWEAAKCYTEFEFGEKLTEISQKSQEAGMWFRTIETHLWTTFKLIGFGHVTANVTESLNGWIQDSSGLPIIQMMECIRRQLMTLFNERRETSMQWSGMLVPSAERRVFEAIEHSRAHQVHKLNESEFEVVVTNQGKSMVVDTRFRSCECRGWQLYGLPCSHAVAVLISIRENVYRYTESYFTVGNYRRTYAETIHPVPDKTMWRKTEPDVESGEESVIRPPKVLRQQPRPRKRRSQGEDRGRQKRVVRCSRCNQAGHFRTTCTAPE